MITIVIGVGLVAAGIHIDGYRNHLWPWESHMFLLGVICVFGSIAYGYV